MTLCKAVMELIRTNKWHSIAQYQNTGVDYAALCRYRQVRDALTVNEDANLVLRDYQVVIPSTLQQRTVELEHKGHQGMSKTKALLRTKVWFAGVDAAVEEAVRSCIPCQANTTCKSKEPLIMSVLPRGPWLEVSIDFCGPLPIGEYLLVMVDEFSRYPIVEVVRNTAAETVVPVVDNVFSTFDYPEVIKSDNGPPSNGHLWREFLQENGVRHRKITPLWPQVNAQAEAFNKPLMKALKAANIKGIPWRAELKRFLRAYRSTPHVSTEFTPHRLMFGRDPRTKLPDASFTTPVDDGVVRNNDSVAKSRMKSYSDLRCRAKTSTFSMETLSSCASRSEENSRHHATRNRYW